MSGSGKQWPWRSLSLGVFLIGLISIFLLLWVDWIRERERNDSKRFEVIMYFQNQAAIYHLRLDEALTGGSAAKMKEAQAALAKAISLLDAILEGGKVERILITAPLRDPEARRRAEAIKSILIQYGEAGSQRLHDPANSGIGSVLERRFETYFQEILGVTEQLEELVEKQAMQNREKSRRLFLGILVIWALIVVVAALGLRSREKRQKIYENELLKANEQLGSQAEELRIHRENLESLVEERTAELTNVNNKLQREITERRQVEEELNKGAELFRVLIETMNEGLVVVDEKGLLAYANKQFCRMLGRQSSDELLGQAAADLVFEADRNRFRTIMERNGDGNGKPYEITFQRKDGKKVFTLVSPQSIFDKDGKSKGNFSVVTDISEKITLQAETMRAAHLASLGELAAGVAHEINNPISGIINYAQMVCNRNSKDSKEYEIASRILKEGRRIAGIVSGLLSFAHQGRKSMKPVHVKKILGDALGLMGSQIKKEGITLRVEMPDDIAEIIANPQQIQQVFMNVISNARQALNQKFQGPEENKILEILGRETMIEGSPFVRIEFFDRGIGIPEGIRHKVTEPFFSTKPEGKGIGMGLSISHGIISDHGGKLAIESNEGEFTRVIIDLPARRQ